MAVQTLQIEEDDYLISANTSGAAMPAGLQELWSVLGHTGATRLLYMGVHENMCTPA